jgi:hypothetical protein
MSTTTNEIVLTGAALKEFNKFITEVSDVYLRYRDNAEALVNVYKEQRKAQALLKETLLKQYMENLNDMTKETHAYDTALEQLGITLRGTAVLTSNMSDSYIDNSGKLTLVGQDVLSLDAKLLQSQRQLSLQYKLAIKNFDDAREIAKSILGFAPGALANLEEAFKVFEKKYELKVEYKEIEIIVKALGSVIQNALLARIEIERFQEALKAGYDTQTLDFGIQFEESISKLKILTPFADRLKNIFEDVDFDAIIKGLETDATNAMYQLVNTLEKESIKIGEDLERSFGLDTIFLDLLGFDSQAIKEVEDKIDGYIQILTDSMEGLSPKLQSQIIDVIEIFDTLKEGLISGDFNEGLENMLRAISDFSYNLGALIGNLRLEEQQLLRERTKAITDQEVLYRKGEITAEEKMKRIAKIHAYYAEQIDDIWKKVGLSVLTELTQMGNQIIMELGIQAAKMAALGKVGFGGILSGLTAFLPFGAVIAGIGLVNSLLSETPSYGPLEFDTPENELSKFGGTIKAEEVTIHISPTFIIEGNQVFIGSGSVVEYVEEATELMKEGVQQSIDNQEFNFDNVRAVN